MEFQNIVKLLDTIMWPIVTLTIIFIFKDHISSLIGRIREFEGPGDIKVSLDKREIKEIIEEGKEKNYSPDTMAERILQSLDKREVRIIRALFDDSGRAIYSYRNSYYKDALQSLLDKGYVEKLERGYSLTAEGNNFAKSYFLRVIGRMGSNSRTQE